MVFESLKGFQFEMFGKTIYFTSLIANALNLIVLTAALSVYNSCVYSNSRMLYGLAEQGNPSFLSKLNKNHVPVLATLVSAAFVGVCIIINKLMPEKALHALMSLVVSALIINWLMISVVHMKFRQHFKNGQAKTKFPSFLYPLSNYICLIFLTGILGLMVLTGMALPVMLIPVWVVFLYICYIVVKRNKNREAL